MNGLNNFGYAYGSAQTSSGSSLLSNNLQWTFVYVRRLAFAFFGPYTISSILICSIVVCSTLTIAEEQSKRHCRWLCQPHYSSKRASMFAQVMHIFVIVVLSWGWICKYIYIKCRLRAVGVVDLNRHFLLPRETFAERSWTKRPGLMRPTRTGECRRITLESQYYKHCF